MVLERNFCDPWNDFHLHVSILKTFAWGSNVPPNDFLIPPSAALRSPCTLVTTLSPVSLVPTFPLDHSPYIIYVLRLPQLIRPFLGPLILSSHFPPFLQFQSSVGGAYVDCLLPIHPSSWFSSPLMVSVVPWADCALQACLHP